MLSFHRGRGLNRREVLRIGAAGLGGLALPALNTSIAEAKTLGAVTGKSVIFLFMQGGPSQFETFDPKMDAPAEIRSTTGEVKTTIPGVTFGGDFKNLARHAHKMAIVRSYQTHAGHGSLDPLVSSKTLNGNIGSLYSRVQGPLNPATGIPSNTAIFPNAVDPDGPGPRSRFGQIETGGSLGKAYAPVVPGGDGDFLKNLQLTLPRDHFNRRYQLLSQLDKTRSDMDSAQIDGVRRRAFDMILNGVSSAFDISGEDQKTIDRYDTSGFHNPSLWQKYNNRNLYAANAKTLGKLLLLSRRLCEAGCGFVSVNTEFVWDMHEDANNLGPLRGMEAVGRPFDHAVSAFIEDLEARGLSDKILLVCVGEMGRTPKLSNKGGRGHWGALAPMMLYGGGLTHGQVIGASDKGGGKPVDTPLNQANLLSTITRTLYNTGEVRLMQETPVDVRNAIENAIKVPGVI